MPLNSHLWLGATILGIIALYTWRGKRPWSYSIVVWGRKLKFRSGKGLAQGHITSSVCESQPGTSVNKSSWNVLSWKGCFPFFAHAGPAKLESMHSWISQHLSAIWMSAVF